MPFVYDQNIYINKKRFSLQVQKPKNKDHKKRVSLYVLEPASLTIEAALVLPLFLLTIMALVYFLVIFQIQMNLQIKMEESAREIAKNEYILKEVPGYSYFCVKKELFSEEFKEYIDSTFIVNGVNGLSLFQSSFNSKKGIHDIVLNYQIKIPFVPEEAMKLSFVQRCRFKTWIGENLAEEESKDTTIVYITKTGTVYHTNRNCTHLNLSIKKCLLSELINLRNQNGGIYDACSLCDKSKIPNSNIVYITDNGDKWHTTIDCSGLKRDIIEVPIDEVGSRGLCQRCEEGN